MAGSIPSRKAFKGNSHPMGESARKPKKPGTMKIQQIKKSPAKRG